eukprot:9302240-Pyramimonas_sp.AAC.1
MRTATLGPSVQLPLRPRNAVVGGGPHADCANGTFGGAPSGATKRCAGCGCPMRTAPLGPSVELPLGPRSA